MGGRGGGKIRLYQFAFFQSVLKIQKGDEKKKERKTAGQKEERIKKNQTRTTSDNIFWLFVLFVYCSIWHIRVRLLGFIRCESFLFLLPLCMWIVLLFFIYIFLPYLFQRSSFMYNSLFRQTRGLLFSVVFVCKWPSRLEWHIPLLLLCPWSIMQLFMSVSVSLPVCLCVSACLSLCLCLSVSLSISSNFNA